MVNNFFSIDRNVELSTIYYIETEVANDWTNISVIKTFPNYDKIQVPLIAVRLLDISSDRFEIGSRTLLNTYAFTIDIFAKSDGQRIDLASYLRNKLSLDWVYYEHSHASGDPDTFNRVANGKVIWKEFTGNTKVDFGEGASIYDKFRHSLTFTASYESNA
jgi:hypothetical protein